MHLLYDIITYAVHNSRQRQPGEEEGWEDIDSSHIGRQPFENVVRNPRSIWLSGDHLRGRIQRPRRLKPHPI